MPAPMPRAQPLGIFLESSSYSTSGSNFGKGACQPEFYPFNNFAYMSNVLKKPPKIPENPVTARERSEGNVGTVFGISCTQGEGLP
jgi:hypothetical protein